MNSVLTEILGYLETGLSSQIRTYYQGRVIDDIIPRQYLPALSIYPIQSTQAHHGTAKSQVVYKIGIRVVLDLVSEFTTAGTGSIIKAQQDLINLMEKRTSGGLADSDSIVGILERNIAGTDYLFTDNYVIDYTQTTPGRKFFHVAADMSIEVTTDLVLRQ
jgi:hypothetical protein